MWIEQVQRRSAKARHFYDVDTGIRRAVVSVHDLHYWDGATWKDVDETIIDDSSLAGFTASATSMRHAIRFGVGGERRWYPRREHPDEYITAGHPDYWDVNRWRVWNLTGLSRSSNVITWDTSAYRVDVTVTWRRIKLDYVLKTAAAYPRVRFPLTATGLSIASDGTITSLSDGQVVGTIDPPVARDANDSLVAVSQTIAAGYLELNVNLAGATLPIRVDPTFTQGQAAVGATMTRLENANPTWNYGVSAVLRVGYVGSSSQSNHQLIQFDVSSIPSNATVTSATLDEWLDPGQGGYGGGGFTVNAYRLLVSWVEGTGNGQAGIGGADWNTRNGSTAWSTAGADGSTTDREASTITSHAFAGTEAAAAQITYTLSNSLVQGWISGALTNNGMVLRGATESGGALLCVEVCSDDHATAGYRPLLTIEYSTTTTETRTATPVTVALSSTVQSAQPTALVANPGGWVTDQHPSSPTDQQLVDAANGVGNDYLVSPSQPSGAAIRFTLEALQIPEAGTRTLKTNAYKDLAGGTVDITINLYNTGGGTPFYIFSGGSLSGIDETLSEIDLTDWSTPDPASWAAIDLELVANQSA